MYNASSSCSATTCSLLNARVYNSYNNNIIVLYKLYILCGGYGYLIQGDFFFNIPNTRFIDRCSCIWKKKNSSTNYYYLIWHYKNILSVVMNKLIVKSSNTSVCIALVKKGYKDLYMFYLLRLYVILKYLKSGTQAFRFALSWTPLRMVNGLANSTPVMMNGREHCTICWGSGIIKGCKTSALLGCIRHNVISLSMSLICPFVTSTGYESPRKEVVVHSKAFCHDDLWVSHPTPETLHR